MAEPDSIKRVIINLLDNAIKYSFPNTQIDIKVFSQNAHIVFEISNITAVDLKSLLPEYYFGKQVQLLGIVGQYPVPNNTTAEIKEIRWTNIAPITVKNSSGDTLEYLDLKQKFGTTDGYDYSLTSNNEN